MSATITLDLVNQPLTERPVKVSDSDKVSITVSYAAAGIAQGIADGKSVTDALDHWIAVANDAVSVYKAHPQQCDVTLTGSLTLSDNSLPHGLLLLVGQNALSLSKQAQSLAAWLDACATHHNEAPEKIELGALQSLLHEADKRLTQKSELKEENELLLLQLQQVQEELEETFIGKREIEEQLKKREQDLETLEKELANAQAEQAQTPVDNGSQQVEDLTEENELLLLQLQQVQEELEHYFIRCKELEAGGASAS